MREEGEEGGREGVMEERTTDITGSYFTKEPRTVESETSQHAPAGMYCDSVLMTFSALSPLPCLRGSTLSLYDTPT